MDSNMLVIDDEAFLAKLAEPPRERNVYPPILKSFKESNVVAVDLTSKFNGKDLHNVVTGIKAAAKRDNAFDGIEVRLIEIEKVEHVCLFNRTLANSAPLANAA